MPAKRLTTIVLAATALAGLAAPAAQAAQPSVDYRPACATATAKTCTWVCARRPTRVCPQYRRGLPAPDAMTARAHRHARPTRLFAMPLAITPHDNCTAAAHSAARC